MEEKLQRLYNECVKELLTIDIDINNSLVGQIDIKLSKRNNKRYGCCKQENPDKNFFTKERIGRRIVKQYGRFNTHHIEISKWVMELNDDIIKNTIIHELIHCMPYCNNHGSEFKKYANLINNKLGYNITTRGNKEQDYNKSNIEYKVENEYKYKIICKKCGQEFLRKRLNKNFLIKYRCGKCNGKLEIIEKR